MATKTLNQCGTFKQKQNLPWNNKLKLHSKNKMTAY